jgi:hypothetical protein
VLPRLRAMRGQRLSSALPKVSERSGRLLSRRHLGHQNREGAAPRDAKSLATRIREALVPRILLDRPGRL